MLDNGPWSTWKHKSGGVYLLRADRMMTPAERTLFRARRAWSWPAGGQPWDAIGSSAGAARIRTSRPGDWPPAPPPVVAPVLAPYAATVEAPALTFANDLGGFSPDGRRCVIVLDGETETPLPWTNVIANPDFGTIVTASGIGVYLVREQPGEPADALRLIRSPINRGGTLPARRSEQRRYMVLRRGPMAHDAESGRCLIEHEAGVTRSSHALTRGIRHELAIAGGSGRPGEVFTPDAEERGARQRVT